MGKAHVLTTSGEKTHVVYHIPVPSGNNVVGIPWSTALVNSGLGGTTVLPDGNGDGGSISAAEKASIEAGTVYETDATLLLQPTMTPAEANAFIDAHYDAARADVQTAIPAQLRMFGHTRT